MKAADTRLSSSITLVQNAEASFSASDHTSSSFDVGRSRGRNGRGTTPVDGTGAACVGIAVRSIAGKPWIERQAERIDGLNVVVLFLFAVALVGDVLANVHFLTGRPSAYSNKQH